MPFGVTPRGPGLPPGTPDELLSFIQFQDNGVNLGGPDADTLNFGANITATRGVGENSNVVTVEVADPVEGEGGSGAPTLVIFVSGATDGTFSVSFSDWDAADVHQASSECEWDDAEQQLRFLVDGTFEIEITGRVTPASGSWPVVSPFTTVYGSSVGSAFGEGTSTHFRYAASAFPDGNPAYAVFNDRFVVDGVADALQPVSLYASRYNESDAVSFRATVSVTRLLAG